VHFFFWKLPHHYFCYSHPSSSWETPSPLKWESTLSGSNCNCIIIIIFTITLLLTGSHLLPWNGSLHSYCSQRYVPTNTVNPNTDLSQNQISNDFKIEICFRLTRYQWSVIGQICVCFFSDLGSLRTKLEV
jgi:hypothetical protein